MKIAFSSQRRQMLLFLTLTHHQHGHRDVTCKPAIGRHLVDVMADKEANINQHIDQSAIGQHANQISDNMSVDISWTTSGADLGLNTDCFPKRTPEGFSF